MIVNLRLIRNFKEQLTEVNQLLIKIHQNNIEKKHKKTASLGVRNQEKLMIKK